MDGMETICLLSTCVPHVPMGPVVQQVIIVVVIVPNPHQGAVATQPRCVTQLHRRTRYITSKRDQGGIGAIVLLLKYCRFKHNYIIVNNIICGVKKSENKVLRLIISFCSSFHMGKFHSTSSSPLRI